MCACVHACVRACMRACGKVCARASLRVHIPPKIFPISKDRANFFMTGNASQYVGGAACDESSRAHTYTRAPLRRSANMMEHRPLKAPIDFIPCSAPGTRPGVWESPHPGKCRSNLRPEGHCLCQEIVPKWCRPGASDRRHPNSPTTAPTPSKPTPCASSYGSCHPGSNVGFVLGHIMLASGPNPRRPMDERRRVRNR